MTEQALFEMLEIIEKSRANTPKTGDLAVLQEAKSRLSILDSTAKTLDCIF